MNENLRELLLLARDLLWMIWGPWLLVLAAIVAVLYIYRGVIFSLMANNL